jgi:hypothetical protein
MTVRTIRKTITFARPFSVSGIDEAQPPGTYVVETEEELLPDLSFPAFRRRATLIWLRSRPGRSWNRRSRSIPWSSEQPRSGMPGGRRRRRDRQERTSKEDDHEA